MFGIGYYSNNDPDKTVKNLDQNYANFESARNAGKTLANHPAFTHKTLVVLDYGQKRAYRIV
jgi:hypothetical protein